MPTLTSLRARMTEERNRLNAIEEAATTENRDYTDAEQAEVRQIQLRMARLSAQISLAETEQPAVRVARDLNAEVRQNVAAGRQTTIRLTRDLTVVADYSDAGIIPLNIGDILEPLEEGLIIHQLGLPMPTGLSGDYIWPSYDFAEASILDEGVEITDSNLDWDKISMQPQRIGAAYALTREAINQTNGVVETVVRRVIPQAVTRLINKVLLSPTKVGTKNNLVGPFVNCKRYTLPANPTYKDFALMKAQMLATGVDGDGACWVMTKAQQAILESTPRDAGSGIMIVEGGRLVGLPIFTAQYIGEGNIGLGDWRYQPMGLYGDIVFTVDPYSRSRKNAIDFNYNVNYGTVTLRSEAFLLGQITKETTPVTPPAGGGASGGDTTGETTEGGK